ncbi:MAG: carbohydrate kinase family protein [Chloroflexi bacterium]|nr:carbohydrate kinase family protein [Chloroflexota bacterium]
MSKVYDVILLDERIYCDLLFTGLTALPALGEEQLARQLTVMPGGIFNTALALKRLGVKVGLAVDVGQDFFSRFINEVILKEGLDPSLIRRHPGDLAAVTVAASVGEDRAFLSYVQPAATPPAQPSDWQGVTARHLHVGGLVAASGQLEGLAWAKAKGWTLSADCQFFAEQTNRRRLRAALVQVEYFLPNAQEALTLTGAATVELAAQQLGQDIPHVIIKCGAQGAVAFSQGQLLRSPALPVTPVDTTAAGDCFNAGFLYGLLNGHSLAECLQYGNIAGGLSTQGPGAARAPTYAELSAYVKQKLVQ